MEDEPGFTEVPTSSLVSAHLASDAAGWLFGIPCRPPRTLLHACDCVPRHDAEHRDQGVPSATVELSVSAFVST
jgi:hypothetical protein